jgi:hypothetical protein
VFTYVFRKGAPIFKGSGDLHDTKYSNKKKSGALYPLSLIGIAESSQYTISFYPRKAFYDEYKSSNPIYFSIGGVSLIALVSLIFLLYDFAVSRHSERQQIVLDTKRRYVRFISHEIRTPLNTVRLGLKLFDLELVASLKMLSEKSPAEAVEIMRRTIEGWVQLTDDALSSTEAAVDVLNDLLNYDKVSRGQFSNTRYPLTLILSTNSLSTSLPLYLSTSLPPLLFHSPSLDRVGDAAPGVLLCAHMAGGEEDVRGVRHASEGETCHAHAHRRAMGRAAVFLGSEAVPSIAGGGRLYAHIAGAAQPHVERHQVHTDSGLSLCPW